MEDQGSQSTYKYMLFGSHSILSQKILHKKWILTSLEKLEDLATLGSHSNVLGSQSLMGLQNSYPFKQSLRCCFCKLNPTFTVVPVGCDFGF